VRARTGLAAAIELLGDRQQVIVRINAGWRDAFADLEAAIGGGVAAIMVPKVEDPSGSARSQILLRNWRRRRTFLQLPR
jgi:citrate lyase beta subunit